MSLSRNLVRLHGALVLLALAGAAQAEPYLAAQMGLKCAQCHVNPTGGGMRTVFGNTFAQTQLAAKRIGGEEDLWTGQVMKFLSVGGNARANWNFSDVPNQDEHQRLRRRGSARLSRLRRDPEPPVGVHRPAFRAGQRDQPRSQRALLDHGERAST